MKIAVIGAGAAGTAITNLLIKEPTVKFVTVIDRNGHQLDELESRAESPKLRVHRVSMEKELSILSLIKGYSCVISALPYNQNYKMAGLAVKAGVNYVDLGGDDKTLREQFKFDSLAKERNIFVIPGAGFAPGMVNILGMYAFEAFDSVSSMHMRAAGLPVNPQPPLNFHLSFSPVGLVNEYLNEVSVIEDGMLKQKSALEGYERFTFESRPELKELEAFYTSGIAMILAEHLQGKVENFSFKSLRYPGHRDIIKAFFDLGFDSEQIIDIQTSVTYKDLLIRQLKKFLPVSNEDTVLASVTITGKIDKKEVKKTYELNLAQNEFNETSAMMACTALSAVQTAIFASQPKTDVVGGVYVPELLINKKAYIEFMCEHGMELSITDEAV
jgi:lysine 6-dehydrogenase